MQGWYKIRGKGRAKDRCITESSMDACRVDSAGLQEKKGMRKVKNQRCIRESHCKPIYHPTFNFDSSLGNSHLVKHMEAGQPISISLSLMQKEKANSSPNKNIFQVYDHG